MKKKALLIAEKPSYMRDIKACYEKNISTINYDIDFLNQVGHTVELIEPSEINPLYKSWDFTYLPIVPENEGGWKYKVIPTMKQIYKDIKDAVNSGRYDCIIHAGDSDQEGELLTRLVLQEVKNTLPVLRLWVNSTAEDDILIGLKNLRSDDETFFENLYHAALVRQHSDWRFGMNGSRAVASRINTSRDNKIAVGRVMTAVQAIVVYREKEIKNFKPSTSYGVKVMYSNGLVGNYFENKTVGDNSISETVYFDTKQEAQDFINSMKVFNSGTVILKEVKKEKVYAPELYNLAAAQYDASKMGFTGKTTLEIIQALYEKHYLTYPRTDCAHVSSKENFVGMITAASSIPGYEQVAKNAMSSISRIKAIKKYVNDVELAKHGHSALCPTVNKPNFSALTSDEQKIYKMICRRFLAIFLPPMEQEKTTIVTKIDNSLFKSTGKVVLEKGFSDFLNMAIKDNVIPLVNQYDTLSVQDMDCVEKTTTCPKRFSDGTLGMAMENPVKYLSDKTILDNGGNFRIGTPSTNADIVEKLVRNKYIKREKGFFKPTEWGTFMIDVLKNIDITKVDMTCKWEKVLTQLKNGELNLEQAEDMMRREVNRMIQDIEQMEKYEFGDISANTKIIASCPFCGHDIIETQKAYFCAGYKEGCQVSIPKNFLGITISASELNEMLNGETISKKLTKDSRSWKQDLALNKEDGHMEFVKKIGTTNLLCPDCGAPLNRNGSKLECSCGFSLWIVLAQKELSEKDLDYILKKGHSNGKIPGFISKKGKAFSAKIILKSDQKNSPAKFEFSFD